MNSELAALFDGVRDHGDTLEEYRALRDTCGLALRVDRRIVRVEGERAAEMLNGLLTNEVKNIPAGVGRQAMLLTAKGRVLTDLRVLPRGGDDLLLDVPEGGVENLLAAFAKYLPPMYATYEDMGGAMIQLAVYGPSAFTAIETALGPGLGGGHLALHAGLGDATSVLAIRNRRVAGDGVELIGPRGEIEPIGPQLVTAIRGLGGRPVGTEALEILRVESGIPLYGVDISEDVLAQETGLEDDAISHDKGCYLGQEVVARIHFRGHVNRHLQGLRFAEPGPPSGTPLRRDDKEVGGVTSSVDSPDLGSIGLGYVRREVPPGDEVRWTSEDGRAGTATVQELPFR